MSNYQTIIFSLPSFSSSNIFAAVEKKSVSNIFLFGNVSFLLALSKIYMCYVIISKVLNHTFSELI